LIGYEVDVERGATCVAVSVSTANIRNFPDLAAMKKKFLCFSGVAMRKRGQGLPRYVAVAQQRKQKKRRWHRGDGRRGGRKEEPRPLRSRLFCCCFLKE
jgi:hypothetical protein